MLWNSGFESTVCSFCVELLSGWSTFQKQTVCGVRLVTDSILATGVNMSMNVVCVYSVTDCPPVHRVSCICSVGISNIAQCSFKVLLLKYLHVSYVFICLYIHYFNLDISKLKKKKQCHDSPAFPYDPPMTHIHKLWYLVLTIKCSYLMI